MKSMARYRKFLKADRWDEWAEMDTDQRKKIAPPSLQKDYPEDAKIIDLTAPDDLGIGKIPLLNAIKNRKSHRRFTRDPLSIKELSFLLWATQGLRKVPGKMTGTRRTVPSGGARHPFETYLIINRVTGIDPGLYRYLPLDHKLCIIRSDTDLPAKVSDSCRQQTFVGKGAVVFIWSVVPYRAEWRYSIVAHKMIAIDAGHLCQNLYLACEAIDAGTCAIGAYTQQKIDALVGVDGKNEFVIYIAPVGKIKKKP